MSVPSVRGTSPAAIAAALPPLEPPGTRSRSHGFRVWARALFSVELPIANSSRFSRPRITAPAARSCSMTWASYGETKSASIRLAAVSFCPFTAIRFFTATGTPSNGPRDSPAARRASASAAIAKANSPSASRNAPTRPSTAAMRSRHCCVSSRAEISPEARAKEAAVAVSMDITHPPPLWVRRSGCPVGRGRWRGLRRG